MFYRVLSSRWRGIAVSLTASAVAIATLAGPAAGADWEWSQTVNAVTYNSDWAPLAADDTGAYYASPAKTGSQLVKVNPDGSQTWTRTPPITGGSASIGGAAADDSGVYLSGIVVGNWPGQPSAPDGAAYLAHYTDAGDFVWAVQFGLPTTDSANIWADTVALSSGVVYFAGGYIGGSGVIAKADRDGHLRWRHDETFGGEFGSAAADADGLVVTDTGGTLDAFSPAGAARWRATAPSTFDIVAAPGGGTLTIGTASNSAGVDSVVVRKVSRTGSVGGPHFIFSRAGSFPAGIATQGEHVFAAWYSDGVRGAAPRIGWGGLTGSLGVAWTRSHDVTSGDLPSAFTASSRGGYILGASLLAKVALDVNAPIVSWNNYSYRPGMLPDDYLVADASWKGRDDVSGIDYFQVQQSENGGAWTDVDLADASAKSALIAEKPGAAYTFRVRAVDKAGNVGKWSTSRPYALNFVQDSSKQISYDINWATNQEPDASGGFVMSASKQGAAATFQFSGSGFGFVSIIGPDRGKVAVFVDGTKVTTVDLLADKQSAQFVSFAKGWSKNGSHTVKLVVQGTNGRPRVDIDGFEVMATQ